MASTESLQDDVTSVMDDTLASGTYKNGYETITHTEVPHGKDPMPQLDVSTFSSQIFWLLLSFFLLYLLISKSALPRIHEIVDKRRHRIERDLGRAAQFSSEATQAKETYEAIQRTTRDKANALLNEATSMATSRQEVEFARTDASVRQMMEQAEQDIAMRVEQFRSKMADTTEELVRQVILELTGKQVDVTSVKSSLDSAS